MPINRKWNLGSVMAAAQLSAAESRTHRDNMRFNGVNVIGDIQEVVALLRGLRSKVNLIALNPGPGIDFSTPAADRVAAFQSVLMRSGIPTFVRRPRGRDIFAACGQLKRTVEIATTPAP